MQIATIIISTLLLVFMGLPVIGWALLSSSNDSQWETTNVTQQIMKPKVAFPTKEQVLAYIADHREPVRLNDPLIGNISEPKVAIAGNTTWVAWLGKVNGTNNAVFLSVSFDEGNTFLPPTNVTRLSNATGENASKLSVGASDDGKNVYAVWRSTNLKTVENVIIYSSSMNSGEGFKTYQISSPNVSSDHPTLTVENDSLLITWIVTVRDWITGQDPCSSNYPSGNTGSVEPGPYTVLCAHSKRW